MQTLIPMWNPILEPLQNTCHLLMVWCITEVELICSSTDGEDSFQQTIQSFFPLKTVEMKMVVHRFFVLIKKDIDDHLTGLLSNFSNERESFEGDEVASYQQAAEDLNEKSRLDPLRFIPALLICPGLTYYSHTAFQREAEADLVVPSLDLQSFPPTQQEHYDLVTRATWSL